MSRPSAADLRRRGILVVSLTPHTIATRPRKAAQSYAALGPTRYRSLQVAGRSSRRADRLTYHERGVDVLHVKTTPLRPGRGIVDMIVNLLRAYLPGLIRLGSAVVRDRARVVHVRGTPLIPLGVLHKLLHDSTLVVDVNERPNSVRHPGSLFSIVSRLEPLILRLGARYADVGLVVTPGHRPFLEAARYRRVHVVRNAPLAEWRRCVTVPPKRERGNLVVGCVGSIFEGRGFEALIDAVAMCHSSGVSVTLRIFGHGRATYIAQLRERVRQRHVDHAVKFEGPIPRDSVCEAYQDLHVGTALYEATDPGNDSLSNKIIECVAAGRPVIASDLPENRAFLEDTGAGWLCDVSAGALYRLLVDLARSTDAELVAMRAHRIGESLTWENEFGVVLSFLMHADQAS